MNPDREGADRFEELWTKSEAAAYGISIYEFRELLINVGEKRNFGVDKTQNCSDTQRWAFFSR